MALLTPDMLLALRNTEDHIEFQIGGPDTFARYELVIVKFRRLCVGLEIEGLRNLFDLASLGDFIPNVYSIPTTVVGSPAYFTLRVVGNLLGKHIDAEMLFKKVSGYFLAIRVNEMWYQTKGNDLKIQDAKEFAFTGNYIELEGGLDKTDFNLGLRPLFQAICNLERGTHRLHSFFLICMHFPEPARFPPIEKQISFLLQSDSENLMCGDFKILCGGWSKIKQAIECYRKTQIWSFTKVEVEPTPNSEGGDGNTSGNPSSSDQVRVRGLKDLEMLQDVRNIGNVIAMMQGSERI